MNARPPLDKIIIEQDEAQDKVGNFLLADTAKEKPLRGTVVAVGRGDFNSKGEVIPMETKVGDRVIYGEFSGQPVTIDGKEYIVLKEKELHVIL